MEPSFYDFFAPGRGERKYPKIPPLAETLFDKILNQDTSQESIQDLATRFVADSHDTYTGDEAAMIAYLFTSGFGHELPADIMSRLSELIFSARSRDGLARRMFERIEIMSSEVRSYFVRGNAPDDYFQPTLLGSPLPDMIIGLECYRIATKERKNFSSANFIVEPFRDPKTGHSGIWMSTTGTHFDPSKLQ